METVVKYSSERTDWEDGKMQLTWRRENVQYQVFAGYVRQRHTQIKMNC